MITGPQQGEVQDVAEPVAAADEVVVDVARVGVCGTDEELFSGAMPYLHDGRAWYPLRIGHEWSGTVSAVGAGVDSGWIGKRVTGDTMIGDETCRRCRQGRHWVCENLQELGISQGRAGALAEKVAVPERSLRVLPDDVDDGMGALVEPGGNSWRAAKAAELQAGERLLVIGAGTIGLLTAMFARSDGADVHILGRSDSSLDFARSLGFANAWNDEMLPELPWDAVIDASNSAEVPARAVQLVEPAKRVVYIGLAPSPSNLDTREMALKDVTAVGILSGSPGLDGAIAAYASRAVEPGPLVGTVVDMDDVADVLAGDGPNTGSKGPKVHVQVAKESGA